MGWYAIKINLSLSLSLSLSLFLSLSYPLFRGFTANGTLKTNKIFSTSIISFDSRKNISIIFFSR